MLQPWISSILHKISVNALIKSENFSEFSTHMFGVKYFLKNVYVFSGDSRFKAETL
jgi:hypothetical protein